MGFKTQKGFLFTGSGDGLKYVSGKRQSWYISEQGNPGATDSPVFQSAATNTDGDRVILTYNKHLSATTAPTSAFTVLVNGSAATLSNVTRNANYSQHDEIWLYISSAAIQGGDTVTVAYTDPTDGEDANAIQDELGNDAASFSATSVTNNVPAGPVFQSAATSGDGTKVILTYNETLSSTTAATSAFDVVVNSSAATITAAARGANTSTIELTLSAAITEGQTVTVAYTDPSGANDANAIQGVTSGQDAASFTATSVSVNLGSNVTLTTAEHYYDEGSTQNRGDVSMSDDSGANETWADSIPVATTSGKRLIVIVATVRTTQGDDGDGDYFSTVYEDPIHFTLALTASGTTTNMTYRGTYAATRYNSTTIWTSMIDGNTTDTDDYSIEWSESPSDGNHGNLAYSGIILDEVNAIEYVNIGTPAQIGSWPVGFSNTDGQTVTTALNVAANNTTAATHVLRIAASNASNIDTNVIDYNKGASEPTYTQIGEGDNGTNERHHHAYYFGTHGTQVNMTGTFGDSSTEADNGISGLGCIIGLR